MRHEVDAALDQCLEWMRGGTAVETCLSRYPEYADELRPLLETVTQVGRVLTPPASRTARAEGQERMLAALAKRRERRERLGPVAFGLRQLLGNLFGAFTTGGLARRPIWQSALLSLVILIFTGSGLALAASGYSLPGEALYSMKLARQELQVALTLDPADQEALLRQFEAQRRQEVGLALAAGNHGEVSFTGTLEDVQSGQWMVAGLGVRVGADTEVSAEPVVGRQVRVLGQLPGDGSLQATSLQVLGDEREEIVGPEATETEPAASQTPEPTEMAGPEDEPVVEVATPEPTKASADSPAIGDTVASEAEGSDDDAEEPVVSEEPADDAGEPTHTLQPGDDDDDKEEPAPNETKEPDEDDGPEATSTPDDHDSDDGGDDGDHGDGGDDHDEHDNDDKDVTPSPQPSETPDD